MDTDTDFPNLLETFPSALRGIRKNSSICSIDSEIEEEPHYTSLKDLILSSTSSVCSRSVDGGINPESFDSSKIPIRNRLVKSAASAYLQSTLVLVNKNESYLLNLFEKVKSNIQTSFSCWNVYFIGPLEACFGGIYQFFACTFWGAWGRMFGYKEETLLDKR